MDADLQDDPVDLPLFINKIKQGYQAVNGYRKERKDSSGIKLISKIGNGVIWRFFLKSPFNDINCGFKAFSRKVIDDIPLYGDNYRFLPLAAFYMGYKTAEVIVNNRSRKYGVSKFNFLKAFFGMIDTLTAYFIFRFSEKPLHFFGSIGGVVFGAGFFLALYLTYERLFLGVLLYRRPALLLAILLIIVGIQIIMTGIVAELIVYLSHRRRSNSF